MKMFFIPVSRQDIEKMWDMNNPALFNDSYYIRCNKHGVHTKLGGQTRIYQAKELLKMTREITIFWNIKIKLS